MNDTETINKPNANNTIVGLINSINLDKRDVFYKIAEDYTRSLSRSGHVYRKLNRLLNEKPIKLIQLDALSSDIKKLIQVKQETDELVYLNNDIKSLIDELLIEWENKEVYKFHNLPIRNKILLHGVTGNGKTTIARHIAKLSKLPFVEVNADVIVDSHIGSTGRNIFTLFNNIKEPCILFWDEVDTIGRTRAMQSDGAAGMENERMVNSILVNIEKLSNDVIFIGATNRREVLDCAFLRRFDIQFELISPTELQKDIFIHELLEYYKMPRTLYQNNWVLLPSYSDIKMALVDSVRKTVLSILSTPTIPS